jgi:hypothetical protein
VPEKDRDKTAFWWGNRLFRFKRLPMGLRNATACFQRVLDREIAQAGLSHCVRTFVDDVIVFTQTAEEHIEAVGRMLDMLYSCGLRAHPDKSIFGAETVEFLGWFPTRRRGLSPTRFWARPDRQLTLPTPHRSPRAQKLGSISPSIRAFARQASGVRVPSARFQKSVDFFQAHRDSRFTPTPQLPTADAGRQWKWRQAATTPRRGAGGLDQKMKNERIGNCSHRSHAHCRITIALSHCV